VQPFLRGSEIIIPGEVNSDDALRLRAKMEQAGYQFVTVEQFAVTPRTAPDFLLLAGVLRQGGRTNALAASDVTRREFERSPVLRPPKRRLRGGGARRVDLCDP